MNNGFSPLIIIRKLQLGCISLILFLSPSFAMHSGKESIESLEQRQNHVLPSVSKKKASSPVSSASNDNNNTNDNNQIKNNKQPKNPKQQWQPKKTLTAPTPPLHRDESKLALRPGAQALPSSQFLSTTTTTTNDNNIETGSNSTVFSDLKNSTLSPEKPKQKQDITKQASKQLLVNKKEDEQKAQGAITCSPISSSQGSLECLMAEIKELEGNGKLSTAAQKMDTYLRESSLPSFEDLCFALALNRQINLTERQKRAQKLGRIISEQLEIKPDDLNPKIKKAPWDHLKYYLEYLVDQTVADPLYEERNFDTVIDGKDIHAYSQWASGLMAQYRYPISISYGNKHASGPKINGIYETYHTFLQVTSHTQKEKEARESFAYRFFEGNLDQTRINPKTFYNLIVRAGFDEQDFKQAQYGYQDRIYVKPVKLQKNTPSECTQEIIEEVSSVLKNAQEPYVVFVFELDSHNSFTVNDLMQDNNSQLCREFFDELSLPATIIETQERRLYFCFHNDKRKTLDLHGLSSQEAFEKVSTFIAERYYNFEDECLIITGHGNHINSNGTKGILYKSLKTWLKTPPLSSFAKTCIPIEGKGGYKVKLVKPQMVDLTGWNVGQDLPLSLIKQKVLSLLQTGDLRLIFKNKTPDMLIAYWTSRLMQHDPELFASLSPISSDSKPGALRLIFQSNARNFSSSFDMEEEE